MKENNFAFFHEATSKIILADVNHLTKCAATDIENSFIYFLETARQANRLCRIILWHYKNVISDDINTLKITGEITEGNKFVIRTFLIQTDGTSIEFKNQFLNQVFWEVYNVDLATEPLIIKWSDVSP